VNRRRFLALLGLAAPAMVLDPEQLLWVPGRKTFFLPGGTAMIVTPDWMAVEGLKILRNNLSLAGMVNRDYGEGLFPGSTVTLRKPARYNTFAR
jgi:hypothetical protein